MKRTLLVLVGLLLAGCAASPPGSLPPDITRPESVRLLELQGFRLYADRGCLDGYGLKALGAELVSARVYLEAFLGPAMAPADFRGHGEPRANCPESFSFGPLPHAGTIDVVVVPHGDRCHADAAGLTVLRRHLTRHDATHELVHYLAGSSWRPIDEGLAVYLTERLHGPDKGFPIRTRARVYDDLAMRPRLEPSELLHHGMTRKDYDVAGAFVGWLIEVHGKERFFRLYAGAAQNYYGIYGIDELELLERFWRYVRNLDVRDDDAYYGFKRLITANK
jgi:hypothetical protein